MCDCNCKTASAPATSAPLSVLTDAGKRKVWTEVAEYLNGKGHAHASGDVCLRRDALYPRKPREVIVNGTAYRVSGVKLQFLAGSLWLDSTHTADAINTLAQLFIFPYEGE